MRDLFAFSTANKFASPEQGAAVQPLREIGEGYFVSTTAKHAVVGTLLWSGLIVLTATSWFGAWSAFKALSVWMGS